MRHAIGAQSIKLWQPQLQGMKAKNIRHRAIKLRLLPGV